MAKKVVSLRFEEDVTAQIDRAAGDLGVSRQVWFDDLVAGALGLESVVRNTGLVREGESVRDIVRPGPDATPEQRQRSAEAWATMSAKAATVKGGIIGGRKKEGS